MRFLTASKTLLAHTTTKKIVNSEKYQMSGKSRPQPRQGDVCLGFFSFLGQARLQCQVMLGLTPLYTYQEGILQGDSPRRLAII